jgi:hypothetical protein
MLDLEPFPLGGRIRAYIISVRWRIFLCLLSLKMTFQILKRQIRRIAKVYYIRTRNQNYFETELINGDQGVILLDDFSALSGLQIPGAKPSIPQPLIFAQHQQPPWLFLSTHFKPISAKATDTGVQVCVRRQHLL